MYFFDFIVKYDQKCNNLQVVLFKIIERCTKLTLLLLDKIDQRQTYI